jgi:hypothetical protein
MGDPGHSHFGDGKMNDPLIDPAPLEFSEAQIAADQILLFFHYAHLPLILQAASKPFCDVASYIVEAIPRNAERTVALRKLLEAKDAAVRANLPPHMPIPKAPPEDRSTDGLAAAVEEASDKLC